MVWIRGRLAMSQQIEPVESLCFCFFFVFVINVKEKNAILDGCSTVDSKLDYDGIGWYSMVLHGTRWYFAVE